jgi:hypothetical protein
MTKTPDNFGSLSDIAGLLDLLNNSEGRDEGAIQFEPAPETPKDTEKAAPLTLPLNVRSNSPDIPTDLQRVGDNRFAAHIVGGMAKLKRA